MATAQLKPIDKKIIIAMKSVFGETNARLCGGGNPDHGKSFSFSYKGLQSLEIEFMGKRHFTITWYNCRSGTCGKTIRSDDKNLTQTEIVAHIMNYLPEIKTEIERHRAIDDEADELERERGGY